MIIVYSDFSIFTLTTQHAGFYLNYPEQIDCEQNPDLIRFGRITFRNVRLFPNSKFYFLFSFSGF